MVNQGRPDSEYWRHHSRDAWGEFMMCATGDEKVYEISVSIEPRTARFSIRSNLSGSRTEVLRSEVEELSAKCKEAPEQLANAEGATQSSNGRRDCSNAANRATGGTGTHEDSQTSVGRSGGENEAARPRAEGSNDSGGIARVEEPETKAVEATAMALNTKAHAAFGSQSSERIAKIDGLSKAIYCCVGERYDGRKVSCRMVLAQPCEECAIPNTRACCPFCLMVDAMRRRVMRLRVL